MNERVQTKWVKALRSGKYTQTRGEWDSNPRVDKIAEIIEAYL